MFDIITGEILASICFVVFYKNKCKFISKGGGSSAAISFSLNLHLVFKVYKLGHTMPWARNYNASLKLLIFQHAINCLDRCSTCGQRYHCDL